MKQGIYAKVAVLLAVIAAVSLGLTALCAPTAPKQTPPQTLRIATSFYPVYIAVKHVALNIDGVEVVNMVDSQTGCLHDYQMSPRDREVLNAADILVINGAGAEPFLEPVLSSMPLLPVVDLSQGQTLLESGHVHAHDEEHEHGQESTAFNSHLWVSPPRYRMQIETLTTALCGTDPANAAAYQANAAAYIQKIDAVWERMQQAVVPFAEFPTVLFHDSLAYAAEDLSLHTVAALNVGEDSGVSAQDLAKAEAVLTGEPCAVFVYDAQYEAVQYRYLQALPENAISVTVDTAVSGADDADAWLRAMETWCEAWEAAA